jgi:7,8-dihydropterin-6-yl-methyl-4-(beta-D-ribofuranosyl)aminobenzene 5'-phosphate synthase
MAFRITVLCENTVGPSLPLIGEHGFSAFIETETGNYLFDTGQGYSIIHNAQCLKKDLVSIKGIFLSHGHYDHTGGLPGVLKLKKKVNVYAHPDIFSEKHALVKANGKDEQKYIGMKFKQEYYEKRGAEFVFNTSFSEVAKGIYLTGEVPRTTNFEKGDPRLIVNNDGKLFPDPLLDDQSLILKTTHGFTLLVGCAHAGLINILQHVQRCFKNEKINTVIGGTHLGFLKRDQLDQTISQLKRYDLKTIGASHCTGLEAAAILFQVFEDKFFFASAGTSMVID